MLPHSQFHTLGHSFPIPFPPIFLCLFIFLCIVLRSFEVTYQLNSYGWLNNGTFDGMMGYVQREEVEFPTAGIFVRQDRLGVTSYAAPTFPLR
jgi:hypothetical protein